MKRMPMSAESMVAILAGAKDLTSRVVVPQPEERPDGSWWRTTRSVIGAYPNAEFLADSLVGHAPYHMGERVALSETWCRTGAGCVLYKADNRTEQPYWSMLKWSSARFMPAEFSRQIVVITSVDAGRLWDMTYEDFVREGWDARSSQPMTDRTAGEDARAWYMALWDSLNAKRGYPASMNPWRYSYGFKEER